MESVCCTYCYLLLLILLNHISFNQGFSPTDQFYKIDLNFNQILNRTYAELAMRYEPVCQIFPQITFTKFKFKISTKD